MGRTDSYLQKSVFETLKVDASLTSLIGADRIFTHVTSKTEIPYILICNWRSEDWSTSSEYGDLHRFDIEVWDDAPSMVLRQEIGSKVIELLHEQPLELDFGHLVNLRLENSFLSVQDHSKIQPLRLKFRATIEF